MVQGLTVLVMASSNTQKETFVEKRVGESSLLKEIREQSDDHTKGHGCDVYPSSPVTGKLLKILVGTPVQVTYQPQDLGSPSNNP